MENILRKLARSYKYRFLYARTKEMNGVKLFQNDTDFTSVQMLFLQWLEVYNLLYSDLSSKENFISEEVIADDIRTEAYLYYRSQKKDDQTDTKKKQIDTHGSIPSVIFKTKKVK
jgi:hypothetical protein